MLSLKFYNNNEDALPIEKKIVNINVTCNVNSYIIKSVVFFALNSFFHNLPTFDINFHTQKAFEKFFSFSIRKIKEQNICTLKNHSSNSGSMVHMHTDETSGTVTAEGWTPATEEADGRRNGDGLERDDAMLMGAGDRGSWRRTGSSAGGHWCLVEVVSGSGSGSGS